MASALIILGLLSVGSLVYFARLAVLNGKRDLLSIAGPYHTEDAVVVAFLSAFYLYLTYYQLRQPVEVMTRAGIIAGIVSTLTLLTFILVVIAVRLRNPLDLFGLWRRDLRTVLLTAVASLAAMLPLVFFCLLVIQHIFGPSPEQPLMIFLRTHTDFIDRAILIFTAVILAPLTEEIIFRGYIYGTVRRYAGRWCGLVFSAALFAVIHAHVPSLLPLFVLAVCLNLAYEYSGSLWTTMLMHGTFNSISIVAAIWWPELGQ